MGAMGDGRWEVGNGLTEVSLQLAKGNEQLPDHA